jgi:hypothetical protein
VERSRCAFLPEKGPFTHVVVTVYYSVAMEFVMPMGMIQWGTEIPRQIAGGKSHKQIAHQTHHCGNLIREIRRGLNSLGDPFTREYILGAPRKVPSELMREADRLTGRHPISLRFCLIVCGPIFLGQTLMDVTKSERSIQWQKQRADAQVAAWTRYHPVNRCVIRRSSHPQRAPPRPIV